MSTATIETPAADTSWRDIPTEDLGLIREYNDKLYRHNAETLGKLHDKLEAGETFGLDAGEVLYIQKWLNDTIADNTQGDEAAATNVKNANVGTALSDTEINEMIDGDEEEEDEEEEDEEEEDATDPNQPVYDPTTPEGRTQYDCQTAELVNRAEQKCGELEEEWAELKAEASEAKKEFETARNRMRKLIREREKNRTRAPQPTVFDKPVEYPETPVANPATAELWKQYPITFERWERFGLTSKDVERLNGGIVKGNNPAHPITTFGDVPRFIAPNPNNPGYARTLADLKGFGETGVNRFQAAEVAFWKWWNDGGEAEYVAQVTQVEAPPAAPAAE